MGEPRWGSAVTATSFVEGDALVLVDRVLGDVQLVVAAAGELAGDLLVDSEELRRLDLARLDHLDPLVD